MKPVALKVFLATLYTDADTRNRFLASPEATAREAGLAYPDVAALVDIDRAGLIMAAKCYTHKRTQHRQPKRKFAELSMAWVRRR